MSLLLSTAIFLNGVLVPTGFCQATRHDGTYYGHIVARSSPERAGRWARQIQKGQAAKCDAWGY